MKTEVEEAASPASGFTIRFGRLRACGRGLCSAFLRISMGLMTIAFIAASGLMYTLSRGPIVFDWLAPTIVQSLNDLYAQRYVFALNSVALASTDHGPTLTVEGLTVTSQDHVLVAAPRAELSVDLAALIVGKIKPRRLEMLDLDLRLTIMPDGRVSVFAGAPSKADAPIVTAAPVEGEAALAPETGPQLLVRGGAALRALLDLVTNPDSVIGAINRVGVTHGRLLIDDRALERTISYKDLSLSLDRSAQGMKLSLAANGTERRWAIVANAQGAPGGRRVFDAVAQDFSLEDFAVMGGAHSLPFDSDSAFSAQIHFALSATDRVVEASGGLRVGPGFFRLNEPDHEPVMIDQLAASASWDRVNRQFAINPIRIKTGALDLTLEGEVSPPAETGGGSEASGGERWVGALRLARPAIVGPERAGQKPFQIDRANLRAQLSLAQKKLFLPQIELASPQGSATGKLDFDFAGEPVVAYTFDVNNLNIQALTRLLPSHIGAPVRGFVFEHAPEGTIRHGVFNARFTLTDLIAMRYERPPPDGAVNGEGDIDDVVLTGLIPGLPQVSGLSGHVRMTGRSLTVEDIAATMETPAQRRLNLSQGRFVISDTAPKPAPATLDFHYSSQIEGVMEILAIPALAAYASMPIDPSLIKGQTDGRLHAQLEIGEKVRPNSAIVSVEANTSAVSIDRFIGAERFDNGALAISHDRSGLHVSGAGRIFGGPATIDIRRVGDERQPTQAQLQVTLDEAARAKAGFALPGVTGPVVAQMKSMLPLSNSSAQIELDLTRASLDNILPGVAKPAGKAAKATFNLVKHSDGAMTLEHFALDAGPTQLAGVVELARDGGFRAAKLSQFRISPGDDARLDAQRSGDALKIVLRGADIDARPMLRAMLSTSTARAPQASGKAALSFDESDIDLKSSIVSGHGKQLLSNVDFRMERRGGRPRVITLTGNFGREPLAVALTRENGGAPVMKIACGDAGALFSYLDMYHRMESGRLNATVELQQGRSEGTLHVDDFFLKGESAIRQLMTQGAHRADDKGGWRFDPDAVRVARLQTQFAWSSGRLSLASGIMSGPEMGLTFDGYVDFARERLDVSGAYVPLYGINNLIGGIPVLGELLAGGAHEGIVAVNYGVTGSMSSPNINISPLSVLTIGVLRKLMSVMDGTARPIEQGR